MSRSLLLQTPVSAPAPTPTRADVLGRAVTETARRLHLGPSALRDVIGVSQPTASRLLQGRYAIPQGSKQWELSALLVRLYRSLSSMVGGSDELARAWLNGANQAFDGRTPLALIKRIEGLLLACEYLDAHRARI